MTDSRKSFSGRPSLSVHSDRSGVESASPDAMGGAAWALRNAEWMVLTSTSVCFMAKSGFVSACAACGAAPNSGARPIHAAKDRAKPAHRTSTVVRPLQEHTRRHHGDDAPGANICMFDCRESRLHRRSIPVHALRSHSLALSGFTSLIHPSMAAFHEPVAKGRVRTDTVEKLLF
jgi:hypothetical protein